MRRLAKEICNENMKSLGMFVKEKQQRSARHACVSQMDNKKIIAERLCPALCGMLLLGKGNEAELTKEVCCLSSL